MTHELDEDDAAVIAATALSDGVAVNWGQLQSGAPEATRAVVEQLRLVEELTRLSAPVPRHWGTYPILGEVGQGGFGTVYRAHDPAMDIDLALKVVAGGGEAALDEARLLAQVNHPNVVRVFGADLSGDDVGIRMEFVAGRTLQEVVAQDGPLPLADVLAVGADVCRALAAIHAVGVVHGDVKASNVMRTDDGRIVLVDLGSGFDRKRGGREAGAVETGTPMYLAPEVLSGAERSPISDVFSVGVLLHYLASAAYPPTPGDPASSRPSFGRIRPDLPKAFTAVVDRAMAADPAKRFQEAPALAAALAAVGSRRAGWWALRLGPAIAAALVVAVAASWREADTPAVPVAESVSAAAIVASPPPPSYTVEAAFFRHRGNNAERLRAGASVAPGDLVSMQFSTTTPAHLYVVNEDERGAAFLLFPLPGQELGNPVPAGIRLDVPGVVSGRRRFWQVTTAGTREHFLVFASPTPLPDLERVIAALPPAAPDQPVLARPLPDDVAVQLRGVGGTVPAPAQAPRLATQVLELLTASPETTSGQWARRLTLENPGRR